MGKCSGRLVLIVHENEQYARALAQRIEQAGLFSTWERRLSGQAGAQADTRDRLAAVIVDLQSGQTDIDAVLNEARRRFPSGVIFALTTGEIDEQSGELLLKGVVSLRKPIRPDVVACLVVGACLEPSLGSNDAIGFNGFNGYCGSSGGDSGGLGGLGAPSNETFGVPLDMLRTGSAPPEPLDASEREQLTYLDSAAARYAKPRNFSQQQLKVLKLHLRGMHDKEIAGTLGCSPTTVYEHWRRMATKAAVRYKSGLVADFHRFLGEDRRFAGLTARTGLADFELTPIDHSAPPETETDEVVAYERRMAAASRAGRKGA